MKYDDPTLRELLAGEYALGALQGAARVRFERLMRRDPALRRLAQEWQQLLSPLAEETPAVAPPPRLLATIQRRIETGAAPKAHWWERLGVWRSFSAVGAVAIVVLAITTTILTLRPPATVSPSYVAVLRGQAEQPAMVVTAFKGPWRLNIEPIALAAIRRDQVLQVWAIEKESGTVRPLAAFAPGPPQQVALSEADWKLVKTAYTLSVTVEPAGSRPVAPTTPVLYSGLCINLRGV